ncbi:hypothetical protein NR798_47370 [Archangium gephyra]|uniref:TolB family protein n=1 Tax=Archangium gephyra TaxID=48 RepID=UPI0035D4C6B0
MQRTQRMRGKRLAVTALLLLGLGCLGARPAPPVVPEPAPDPGRTGPGPWLLRFEQSNLWVRTPSGDTGYALTRTGRVVATPLAGTELGWNGVAISPDGRRVAYVETAGRPGTTAIAGWSLLWVVNADGTERRLLVDLREHTPLEGDVRAGAILWSSDGSRVAYVLESFEKKSRGRPRGCPLATVEAVELASGRRETVFTSPERGLLQPRGWPVERGEFFFSLQCKTPPDQPWSTGSFVTLRLGGSARERHARGSLSPDGQHLLLLPSEPRWERQPPAPLWNGQELEAPPDFHPLFAQHVAWMHEQPVAYVTTYRGYGGDCIASMEPPPALYRVEGGSVPRVEHRTRYPWLVVLDFSPDDAYLLMAVVARRPQDRDGCAMHSFESLRVAERSRFEARTSLEELLATSVRVDEPSASIGRPLQGFIGWLR